MIILEEDLEIAPDFFVYFGTLAPFLDSDPNLLAISAWNDNGMGNRVRDPQAVYRCVWSPCLLSGRRAGWVSGSRSERGRAFPSPRHSPVWLTNLSRPRSRSDFFPGLGWMLNRETWAELDAKWPRAYWDDWLREPKQRKSRQVLRPEVCRTFHFGVRGTSNSQYSDFLTRIKLNDQYVDFSQLDLSYLEAKAYERDFLAKVGRAREVQPEGLRQGLGAEEVKVMYESLSDGRNSFEDVAQRVGVMENIKARVPRAAYQGIVTFWEGPTKVYLVPKTPMY